MWGLEVLSRMCLVMYAYDGCEGGLRVLVVFGPFRCGVVFYGVWWDGGYCVYVNLSVDGQVLCGPIFIVDNEDGGGLGVFFCSHSGPVYGFEG